MPRSLSAEAGPGGEVDLAEEALAAERLAEVAAENLEGHVAAVAEVAGEVDGGHSARANLALETVAVGERGGEAGRRGGGHSGATTGSASSPSSVARARR